MIFRFIKQFGEYIQLLGEVFGRPTRRNLFLRQLSDETYHLCMGSLLIVSIISFFMGAAVAVQLSLNIDTPLLPTYAIGYSVRKAIILEFSPTVISLILAGKIGSQIASELGTMRITEQIDAIEVMGINPANYLILPKITACVVFCPILIMLSIVIALCGAWLMGVTVGDITSYEFMYGLQAFPENFDLVYALIKTVIFAFITSSFSAYKGFNVRGGALEVGKASTQAVVGSSICIILCNLLLTQLLVS